MIAVVAAFNKEKALVGRGLLRDYELSMGPSFETLLRGPPVVAASHVTPAHPSTALLSRVSRTRNNPVYTREGRGYSGGKWGPARTAVQLSLQNRAVIDAQ